MFINQPTFNTSELQLDKGTEYVIVWKSKGLYASKFIPLYTASLHIIKSFG